MQALQGKKIILGITGSIAAYKSIHLLRLLTKAGAEVQVIMTPAAKDFVAPLTLATLSGKKVLIDMFAEDSWANHVMLGRWADLMLIVPASCNTIAKMANGGCDNLLMAVYLSATCPVAVAPAMDEDMWHHKSTKRNIALLQEYGHQVLPVGKGSLASGLEGDGRVAEPEFILTWIVETYFRKQALAGEKALVTAGPTHEPIDPVRFIGNRSSGKMGIALAEALYMQGAEVLLIAGPTDRCPAYTGIRVVSVQTAEQMYEACMAGMDAADIIVMNAAVADYTPQTVADQKIKKTSDAGVQLDLVKTKDILQAMGERKRANQLLLGFALETNDGEINAHKKLEQKKLDAVVLNTLEDAGAGFGFDTNKAMILSKQDRVLLPLQSKQDMATAIVDYITTKRHG
jgi:phosphopantothenoylcysteine decarboxylase/phosphopantothenate--cysteine ligase